MSHDTNSPFALPCFLRLSLAAAFLLCLTTIEASAQDAPRATNATHATTATAAPAAVKTDAAAAKTDPADEPQFQGFKGVRIGMTADEARKKLGSPTDKGDTQDFYLVSDKESVQVMYDPTHKVSALAMIYMNAGANAPTAKAVMGTDLEARADGSLYKMVRYPKAGYWVSYSRTAGDSPIVSVTMQKMN